MRYLSTAAINSSASCSVMLSSKRSISEEDFIDFIGDSEDLTPSRPRIRGYAMNVQVRGGARQSEIPVTDQNLCRFHARLSCRHAAVHIDESVPLCLITHN